MSQLKKEQKKRAYARRVRKRKDRALGISADDNLQERIGLLLDAIMEEEDLYGFEGSKEVTIEEYESLLAVYGNSHHTRPEQVRVAKFALATRGF